MRVRIAKEIMEVSIRIDTIATVGADSGFYFGQWLNWIDDLFYQGVLEVT
jgi:hypothetical protein